MKKRHLVEIRFVAGRGYYTIGTYHPALMTTCRERCIQAAGVWRAGRFDRQADLKLLRRLKHK